MKKIFFCLIPFILLSCSSNSGLPDGEIYAESKTSTETAVYRPTIGKFPTNTSNQAVNLMAGLVNEDLLKAMMGFHSGTKISKAFDRSRGQGVTVSTLNKASLIIGDNWRGLKIAPEYRCSPYNQEDYRYPQSLEPKIFAIIGIIYCPYTGKCFVSLRDTDIEHIIARSEAHDSGLCAADLKTRRHFASDLDNLTLADPFVNRHQKRHYDAAEWMPALNQCWYANRIVEVRREYNLTIDRREAEFLESVLSSCTSTEMVIRPCESAQSEDEQATAPPNKKPTGNIDALSLWDDNRNGRITCAEARRHGIAPVPRSHPAYRYMRDGDGDGVVCE